MTRLLMSEVDLRRFYSKFIVDLRTGCWNYHRSLPDGNNGYARFRLNGRVYPAHVVAYNHFVEEVPDNLELGHLRQGDKCAFWEHVRPVTHEDNMKEWHTSFHSTWQCKIRAPAGVPVCIHGHPYTPRNTGTDSKGYVRCDTCQRYSAMRSLGYSPCKGCGYSRCKCSTYWA